MSDAAMDPDEAERELAACHLDDDLPVYDLARRLLAEVRRLREHECPETDDGGGSYRAAARRLRDSEVYKAHKAAGLCTLHNGTFLCGRASSHDMTDGWPPRHEFTGPRINA